MFLIFDEYSMYKDLNPLLHSQLRLTIMSMLVSEGETDFAQIKEVSKATSGNISVQLKKLEEAKYIKIVKTFKNNYPNTSVELTSKGLKAFEDYVESLKGYIRKE